jgi:recombination protein U
MTVNYTFIIWKYFSSYSIITIGDFMKYPKGIKVNITKNICYSNRGMSLEEDINLSNQYYLDKDIAIIHKKPTPVQITKVEFKNKNSTIIKEGFFKTPSTTDYNGIYKGKYIDFEAKETKNKTSFPLNNIHKHQFEHMEKIIKHNGIGFFIIRFSSLSETYLIKGELVIEQAKNKKSIGIDFFRDYGFKIEEKYNPRLDYIKIVNKLYFGGDI